MAKPKKERAVDVFCENAGDLCEVEQHDFLCLAVSLADWLDTYSDMLTDELSELREKLIAGLGKWATTALHEPMQFFMNRVPLADRRAILTNPGFLKAYEYAAKNLPPIPTLN